MLQLSSDPVLPYPRINNFHYTKDYVSEPAVLGYSVLLLNCVCCLQLSGGRIFLLRTPQATRLFAVAIISASSTPLPQNQANRGDIIPEHRHPFGGFLSWSSAFQDSGLAFTPQSCFNACFFSTGV